MLIRNKTLAVSMAGLCLAAMSGLASAAWQERVDPALLEALTADTTTDFMVVMQEQADLSGAQALPTKAEKGAFVTAALKRVATRSQAGLIANLDARGLEYRSFWVVNALQVTGGRADVEFLAGRGDVQWLNAIKPHAVLEDVQRSSADSRAQSIIEPGVETIGAPAVWAMGYRGQGVVVADHDIGVMWDHPALIGKYRGWDGSNADHAYNWRNAFGRADPFCADPEVPCDSHDHGTHTTGTMVGDDGQGNQIGVAPGAQWIACRSLYDPVVGLGTVPTYLDCMEWTLAPYPYDQPEMADPLKAPDVVNNSWGCLEACPPSILQATDEAVRAAGIVQVVSAGNEGSDCSTIAFPLAIYESSFSVGATTVDDVMAGFSSRGPVLSDLSMRTKPNIVAPGVSTRSSTANGSYSAFSGTSMAAPHVSGLVALLMSAEPRLKGRVDDVRHIIEQTAVPIMHGETCGGTDENTIPNNTSGYGRIDAVAAVMGRPQLTVLSDAGRGMDNGLYTASVTLAAGSVIPATGVEVSVMLPPDVSVAAANRPLARQADGLYTYELGALEPGASANLELTLQASNAARISVPAFASADQVSPVAAAPVDLNPVRAESRAAGLIKGGALGWATLLVGLLAIRRRPLRR